VLKNKKGNLHFLCQYLSEFIVKIKNIKELFSGSIISIRSIHKERNVRLWDRHAVCRVSSLKDWIICPIRWNLLGLSHHILDDDDDDDDDDDRDDPRNVGSINNW